MLWQEFHSKKTILDTKMTVSQQCLYLKFKLCLFLLSILHSDLCFFFTQVLSHNLYTVLCIPHDPVALEDHFRDDDDGPVSSQGYMPYLNQYILDKVS